MTTSQLSGWGRTFVDGREVRSEDLAAITQGAALSRGLGRSYVHGKNHHVAGTFGRHVRSLVVRTGLGQVVHCSREHEPELFLATLGGMGLTGHILEIEVTFLKIPSPWIYEKTETAPNLDVFLQKLLAASEQFPMTVSWIDTIASGSSLGRGIIFGGRWAEPSEAKAGLPKPRAGFPMPIDLPKATE